MGVNTTGAKWQLLVCVKLHAGVNPQINKINASNDLRRANELVFFASDIAAFFITYRWVPSCRKYPVHT
jgi:hypothetical protein